MSNIPNELLYTADHEWVRIEGEHAYIGITEHAQQNLGDIVYIEFPEIGTHINAKEEFGTVESVKAVSSLVMPIAGEILEKNLSLMDNLTVINEEPYQSWFIKIKITDLQEVKQLLKAEEYQKHTEEG